MIERLRSPFYYYEWLGLLGGGILWGLFTAFRISTVSPRQIEKVGGAR